MKKQLTTLFCFWTILVTAVLLFQSPCLAAAQYRIVIIPKIIGIKEDDISMQVALPMMVFTRKNVDEYNFKGKPGALITQKTGRIIGYETEL